MENLDKYMRLTKLKQKSDETTAKKSAILAEYKAKEKGKPLSQGERLTRIERLLGVE